MYELCGCVFSRDTASVEEVCDWDCEEKEPLLILSQVDKERLSI